MDKKKVTRIPSIFDSDDDEEESSQTGSFVREENVSEENESPCVDKSSGDTAAADVVMSSGDAAVDVVMSSGDAAADVVMSSGDAAADVVMSSGDAVADVMSSGDAAADVVMLSGDAAADVVMSSGDAAADVVMLSGNAAATVAEDDAMSCDEDSATVAADEVSSGVTATVAAEDLSEGGNKAQDVDEAAERVAKLNESENSITSLGGVNDEQKEDTDVSNVKGDDSGEMDDAPSDMERSRDSDKVECETSYVERDSNVAQKDTDIIEGERNSSIGKEDSDVSDLRGDCGGGEEAANLSDVARDHSGLEHSANLSYMERDHDGGKAAANVSDDVHNDCDIAEDAANVSDEEKEREGGEEAAVVSGMEKDCDGGDEDADVSDVERDCDKEGGKEDADISDIEEGGKENADISGIEEGGKENADISGIEEDAKEDADISGIEEDAKEDADISDIEEGGDEDSDISDFEEGGKEDADLTGGVDEDSDNEDEDALEEEEDVSDKDDDEDMLDEEKKLTEDFDDDDVEDELGVEEEEDANDLEDSNKDVVNIEEEEDDDVQNDNEDNVNIAEDDYLSEEDVSDKLDNINDEDVEKEIQNDDFDEDMNDVVEVDNELDDMEEAENDGEDIDEMDEGEDEMENGDEYDVEDLNGDEDEGNADESLMDDEDENDTAQVDVTMTDNEGDDSLDAADGDQKVEENEEEDSNTGGAAKDFEEDKDDEGEDKDDHSMDEDGSDSYVIELNGSDDEKYPESESKVEDSEVVLNSSSSSVIVDEERATLVDEANDSEEKRQDKGKSDVLVEHTDKSVFKPSSAVENTEERSVQSPQEKNAKENKGPETIKKQIPLVRVPVRVEDIYTDSEDEAEKGTKDSKDEVKEVDITNETIASVDLEGQTDVSISSRHGSVEPELSSSVATSEADPISGSKDEVKEVDITNETIATVDLEGQTDVSISSRHGSVEPELSSSVATSEADPLSDGHPRIWVSSSIFERKMISEKKTPSGNRRRRGKPNLDFDKEKCIYALNKGWRREMVHRATVDVSTPAKIRADIYYYTPEGKKLRSKVEIEDYLLRKGVADLTIENFSFSKEALGGAEGQEVIRSATKSTVGSTPRRKLDSSGSPATGSPATGRPTTGRPATGSPATGRPATESPATGSPSATPNTTKLPESSVPKRGRPPKTSYDPPAKRMKTVSTVYPDDHQLQDTEQANVSTTFRKIVQKGSDKSKMSNVVKVPAGQTRPLNKVFNSKTWSPDANIPTAKPAKDAQSESQTVAGRHNYRVNKNHVVFTTRLCDSGGLPARILSPMLSDRARQQTFHCTGLCYLGAGTVPSLQCIKCLCLFHGKCTKMPTPTVELIQNGGAKFLCPNCYKENKENTSIRIFKPPTPYEPLVHDPTSSSESDDSDIEVIQSSRKYPKDYLRVNVNRVMSMPTPPSSPMSQDIVEVETERNKEGGTQIDMIAGSYSGLSTGTTTISAANHSHLANSSLNSLMQPIAPGTHIQNNNTVMGGQLLQIQTPGQAGPRFILVRPPQVNSNLQNCTQVGPARALYLPSVGNQVPIMLSGPGSTYCASAPQYVNGGSALSPQVYATQGMQYAQPISSTTFQPSIVQERQSTPPRSVPKIVAVKKDFLQELSLSYRLLLRVFKYLTAKDLLVTSRVCLMWRDLSYSSTLWSTLRLRNICVRNWNLLAIFLERRSTKNIDLRKMVFRIKQSSPEPEDHSRVEYSSESDSPPSKKQNLLQKRLPSTENISNEELKDKSTHSTDGDEDKIKNQEFSSDISPTKETSKIPVKKEYRSSSKDPCRSPLRKPSKSPVKESSRSPVKESSRSPLKEGSESPTKEASNSPYREVPITPGKDICRSPDKVSSKRELSASPSKQEASVDVLNASNYVEEIRSIPGKSTDVSKAEKSKEDTRVSQSTKDNQKGGQDADKMHVDDTKEGDPFKGESMEIDEDVPMDGVEDNVKVLPAENEEDMEKVEEGKQAVHTVEGAAKRSCNAFSTMHDRVSKRRRSRAASTASCVKDESLACKNKEVQTWRHICGALGTVRCLKSVVLPPCIPEVLQLLLSNCKNVTSLTAADIVSPSTVQFDPAYLMEASKLKEIRIGSSQGLSFTTNFNFIKLQDLKVLVIKGFVGNWPYLGTNLTSLHLGPCRSFSPRTWNNIGSMTNLRALWLEDGGSINDVQIIDALNRLHQLRRLCLFNFTVGVKLGIALKKLTRLERLFVLQDSSDDESMGLKNHNMLAVTEHLRYVDELVWAVSSQDIKVIGGVDHMLIFSPKVKSYPSLSAKLNGSDQWPLKLIETVIKRHLPMTKVRIMKLDPAAAARMALSTL